jgi:hypoxanthine phosphoribosyltransferase/uncharacterized HAD superfamily protein
MTIDTSHIRVFETPAPTQRSFYPCDHRTREPIKKRACETCRGKQTDVYGCAIHEECTIGRRRDDTHACIGCDNMTYSGFSDTGPWRRHINPTWVSTIQCMRDIQTLLCHLPPDITAVAGVARSGLAPAAHIAMALHLPLYAIDEHRGLIDPGHGFRLNTNTKQKCNNLGPLLVVDDTVCTGRSLQQTLRTIKPLRHTRPVITAGIYVTPERRDLVDYAAVELPKPHYLEWNFFNSHYASKAAFDFDGILCHDCPASDDDDDHRYCQFLKTVRPLHLVRRWPIPLIVTARLERYRPETEAWLTRWGMSCRKLVMGPWPNVAERRTHYDAGQYKGKAYADSCCNIFVESCPQQAEAIAKATDKRVICPATSQVWN